MVSFAHLRVQDRQHYHKCAKLRNNKRKLLERTSGQDRSGQPLMLYSRSHLLQQSDTCNIIIQVLKILPDSAA